VVGTAQRLEQLADPGRIYAADPTAKLVAGWFALRDLGAFELRGVPAPVRVHELEGAGALRTRFEVSRSRGLSHFVGRSDEMASLEAALARAGEGHGQVVGVVAEPGVGKSRLCFELLERCRARGLPTLEGRALAHGKSVPFLTILQVFRGYFGITEQDSDRVAREKIAGHLLLLDEAFRVDLPILFEFHGVPDPERPAPDMDPELRQRRLFAVLRRLVREGGPGEVGIALLEDLHWLDGGSAAFLEQWVETLAGTRNLLVVNFRPEYHAAWMQRSWYQQLPLSPLGPEATRELLRELLGPHPSVAALAEAIHARTAGNPFFTEEVVQALVESGQLEGTKGSYRLARPVEEIAVPATVHSLLAARIDRLPEREKQVLQTAAVIGREFSLPILERIAELPERELTEALARLEAAELVFAQSLYPVAEYVFKHVLTQEVAYGTQLGERRRRLHAAVARAMEEVDAARLDERAALLAHHFEAAGEALEAARWHRRAAEFAARSDLVEARSHWTRAHALVVPLPPSPERDGLLLRACLLLLDLGWRLGVPEGEAAARFAEGHALAEGSRDLRSLALLHLAHGYVLGQGGIEEGRLREIRAALEVASRIPDERLRAEIELRALGHRSYALYRLGRPGEGLEAAEQALSLRDAAGGPRRANAYAFAVSARAMNLLLLGRLDEARRGFEHAAETARELGDLDGESSPRIWRPFLAWIAGDAEECLAQARALFELSGPRGRFGSRGALAQVGMAHLLASRWEEAADSLSRSVAIVRERRISLHYVSLHLALLADAQLGGGLGDEARKSAQQALELARQRAYRGDECLARLALARVVRATEGPAARGAIESQLDAAAEIVEETGAVVFAPFVAEERAAVARLVGDEAGWERSLREAQRLFAEMGARSRAERLARELGG
jgi:adenylate cyclase